MGKGPVRFGSFTPPYQPVKVLTLASSGTVIPGSVGYSIVIEYHTQQNLGTSEPTVAMLNGTVPHNENPLATDTTLSWCAPFPGREFRCSAGTPFVVTLSTAGSVLTNTRYWFEEYP